MARNEYPTVPLAAQATISAVIARYGAWRVLWASMQSIAPQRRPGLPRGANDLPALLRRDVGLPATGRTDRHWTNR